MTIFIVFKLPVVLDRHLLSIMIVDVLIVIVDLAIRDYASNLSRDVIFFIAALLMLAILKVLNAVLLLLLHLELHLALLALARVDFLGSSDCVLNVKRHFFVLPVLSLVVAVLVELAISHVAFARRSIPLF